MMSQVTPASEPHVCTEHISARYEDLDSWPVTEMVAAMLEGQLAAVAAVGQAVEAIAAAVEAAVPALQRSGRIVYVGAGTSGRIAVQDGAELTPTFDWPSERLVFLLAGGMSALTQSIEGAEDKADQGAQAVRDANLTSNDVVVGVAASGRTPYTVGALRAANTFGAVTIAVAGNPGSPLLENAKYPILVETGAEVIAGSTRMKAGTAQKVVLNLLSTALMIKMGRVYGGLMVHMRIRNAKLKRRGEGIIARILKCSEEQAAEFLEAAGGDVKTAVLLGFGLSGDQAATALERFQGNLRAAINSIGHHDG